MEIVKIFREILRIFWTTWGMSTKFAGKVWLMVIWKVTKNQGFTLSLEDVFFEKPLGGGSNWPPSAALGLIKLQALSLQLY